MIKMRKCKECGKMFEPKFSHHIYCSEKCRSNYNSYTKVNREKPKLKEKSCIICGKKFRTKIESQIYCTVRCRNRAIGLVPKRIRKEAIIKLAEEKQPKCTICGCPHIEVLTIGHFNNDGKKHREELKERKISINTWVLKTPIEQVRKKVQLECAYCQFYFTWIGEYPRKIKGLNGNKYCKDFIVSFFRYREV